jgi:hypothetical protein
MKAQDRVKADLDQLFVGGRDRFAKLRGRGEPYRFDKWKHDDHGQLCLYYTFDSHQKRVPLDEFVVAIRSCVQNGVLTRDAFRRECVIAESAGPCGFAVTGRCLELLGVARYEAHGLGFRLTDKARALQLLES